MSQVEGDDGRVLENFIDVAGRLLSIPVQRKKRLAVLRWMVEDFQPGRLYPEEEVNRIISRRHPDFAALRRYLVDEELMQRRRGRVLANGQRGECRLRSAVLAGVAAVQPPAHPGQRSLLRQPP